MKKLMVIILAIAVFTACEKKESRYTQNSKEIETVKKLVNNYNNKTYDMSIYADTSKTFYNTKVNAMTPSQTLAYHQANDANYSSRGFLPEDQEYEMVTTDDGETWVNCWLDWKATLASNDKEFNMPVHLTYRFVDGKIVREVGMWDPSAIVLASQTIQAEKNQPEHVLKMMNTFDMYVDAWNSHDSEKVKSLSVKNFERYANGIKEANTQDEYAAIMDGNFKATPNLKFDISNVFAKDGKIYHQWTGYGTNTGEFMGNPATGNSFKIHGLTITSYNDEGLLTRDDSYYSPLDLFSQLGYTAPEPK